MFWTGHSVHASLEFHFVFGIMCGNTLSITDLGKPVVSHRYIGLFIDICHLIQHITGVHCCAQSH